MEYEPRPSQVYHAKLTEYSERHSEMVQTMQAIARGGVEMNVEERHLFAVAHKNMLDPLRKSWQWLVDTIAALPVGKKDMERRILEECKVDIEADIKNACFGLVDLIERHILPLLSSAESRVFFYKMKGDYQLCRGIGIRGIRWTDSRGGYSSPFVRAGSKCCRH